MIESFILKFLCALLEYLTRIFFWVKSILIGQKKFLILILGKI